MGKIKDDVDKMSMNELRREVRRLRHNAPDAQEEAKFTLWLREIYHNRGFPGVVEETYKIYAEMKRLAADYEYTMKRDWEYDYHREMVEAVANAPDKTHVAALLMVYSPDEPDKIWTQLARPHEFNGTREEAEGKIFPQIVFALLGIPTLTDLGKQELYPLNQYLLMAALAELFYPGQDPDTFDQRRKAKFEEIWAYIEREYPNNHDTKSALSDKFTKIVNRTRDRMMQRLSGVSMVKQGSDCGRARFRQKLS